MEAKWERQQVNQLTGAYLVLEGLLISHPQLFTEQESQLISKVSGLLKQKVEELRKGSPGGG